MTNRQIENRIRKLQTLEAQIKELEKQQEDIKDELKAFMEAEHTDEITTDSGLIVRWKEIISNRFDSSSFKKAYPSMYQQFLKVTSSMRFTVA